MFRRRASRLLCVRSATDAYSVLGLSPTCTEGDIRHAYKELVKTHHPDAQGPSEGIEAEQMRSDKMADINRAYQVLIKEGMHTENQNLLRKEALLYPNKDGKRTYHAHMSNNGHAMPRKETIGMKPKTNVPFVDFLNYKNDDGVYVKRINKVTQKKVWWRLPNLPFQQAYVWTIAFLFLMTYLDWHL